VDRGLEVSIGFKGDISLALAGQATSWQNHKARSAAARRGLRTKNDRLALLVINIHKEYLVGGNAYMPRITKSYFAIGLPKKIAITFPFPSTTDPYDGGTIKLQRKEH
jgi:hypothetical protein